MSTGFHSEKEFQNWMVQNTLAFNICTHKRRQGVIFR